MKVKELMSPGAVCVRSDSSLLEAGTLMRHLGTTALPVCDHDRLAGLLTEADLAKSAVRETAEPGRVPVRVAMEAGIVFVFEDDDLPYAEHLMEGRGLDHIPVINRDHRLVGMLSLSVIEQHAAEFNRGAVGSYFSAPGGAPRCSDR